MIQPPSTQAPSAVVMVRPQRFRPNAETAVDNAFQVDAVATGSMVTAAQAYEEVTRAVARLRDEGVRVHLFEDAGDQDTPDSVFPNNWFSTHADGRVALYPMCAPNRRRERRVDVIAMLHEEYVVSQVMDYSHHEQDGVFLEGTGAMVIDHPGKVAYMARSNRADPGLFQRFAQDFGLQPQAFDAVDREGRPIYHTNVMMCVGTHFALLGEDTIATPAEASRVRSRLERGDREVIALSHGQIAEFAGNAIELSADGERIVAMSQRALDSLSPDQKARLQRHARPVALPVPTIEMAGGSVRCMMAGIHLSPRR